jgi:hypothetical protein
MDTGRWLARFGSFVNQQAGSSVFRDAGDLFTQLRGTPLPSIPTPRFTIHEIRDLPSIPYGPHLPDVAQHPLRVSPRTEGDIRLWNQMTAHLRSENFRSLSSQMQQRVINNTYNSMSSTLSETSSGLSSLPSLGSRLMSSGRSAMGAIYSAGARVAATLSNPTVAAVLLGVLAVAAIGYGVYRLTKHLTSPLGSTTAPEPEVLASQLTPEVGPGPGFLRYYTKMAGPEMVDKFFRQFPVSIKI